MKKLGFVILLTIFSLSAAYAQRETPAGAGDKNLADDGIKMRSVELDRIKKEALQQEAASFAPINTKLNAKFPEIKEDFEGIQVLLDSIARTYMTGKTIDYKAIAGFAEKMNAKGKRLDANLFADTKKDKEDKTAKETEKEQTVRDLIILLDQRMVTFTKSKIFANIKVIEPDDAIATRSSLLDIIKFSDKLAEAAKKMQ